jgi:hypothetical protein
MLSYKTYGFNSRSKRKQPHPQTVGLAVRLSVKITGGRKHICEPKSHGGTHTQSIGDVRKPEAFNTLFLKQF